MAENSMTYAALTSAGKEKYLFSSKCKIQYPEGEVVEWYGYRRHNFELEGCKGFIVEPPHPAPGLPWSWCLQWAEAFVPRTPALQLLERGFHHVHMDVFSTYMNDEGVKKLEKFYDLLQSMHFDKKAALTFFFFGAYPFALRIVLQDRGQGDRAPRSILSASYQVTLTFQYFLQSFSDRGKLLVDR